MSSKLLFGYVLYTIYVLAVVTCSQMERNALHRSIQAQEKTIELLHRPCPRDTVYIDLSYYEAEADYDTALGAAPWKEGRRY